MLNINLGIYLAICS